MKKSRAFLKWAGGKFTLVEKIRSYLPEGDELIEPFVGAGSVFLNTSYSRYILADINQDLISLFKIIKQKPQKFVNDVRLLFTHQNNNEHTFYTFRENFNQSKDTYLRSLLFLYLNRHGYNGLCRYNNQGEFNVPFGKNQKIYFPEKEIFFFSEKAQNAQFFCSSYEKIMNKATPGSVIYCDPPYEPLSVSASFTTYYTNGFSAAEQQNLALLAEKIVAKYQIPVLISNHNTENTRKWYKNARIHQIESQRSISCMGNGRKKINELLAFYS